MLDAQRILYIRNVRANMSALKKGKVSFARISKMIRGKHSTYDTLWHNSYCKYKANSFPYGPFIKKV